MWIKVRVDRVGPLLCGQSGTHKQKMWIECPPPPIEKKAWIEWAPHSFIFSNRVVSKFRVLFEQRNDQYIHHIKPAADERHTAANASQSIKDPNSV